MRLRQSTCSTAPLPQPAAAAAAAAAADPALALNATADSFSTPWWSHYLQHFVATALHTVPAGITLADSHFTQTFPTPVQSRVRNNHLWTLLPPVVHLWTVRPLPPPGISMLPPAADLTFLACVPEQVFRSRMFTSPEPASNESPSLSPPSFQLSAFGSSSASPPPSFQLSAFGSSPASQTTSEPALQGGEEEKFRKRDKIDKYTVC